MLAYEIDAQTQDGKFVFFSRRLEDDTLRFLRTDWKYTDLALRFVRNGKLFNGHTVFQHHGSHSSSSAIRQKRTCYSIDAANPQPQKRAHLSSAETSRHTLGRSEQPLQVASCHDDGHSDSESHVAEIRVSHVASQSYNGQQTSSRLCQSDHLGSRENSLAPADKLGDGSCHPTLGSHTDKVAYLTPISRSSDGSSRPIITEEHIKEVRIRNEELKIANTRKKKEMLVSLALSGLI